MGQFVYTNGDYNIKSRSGGTITLDPGSTGSVVVKGDLQILGTQVAIDTTQLNIKDNVIILNQGETGSGVSLRYSGVQVDRGTSTPALFVFDESDNTWEISQGVPGGIISYTDSKLRVTQISTSPDNGIGGDLILIGTGSGVVKVGDRSGSGTDYEDLVTDDDDIPNKAYVDTAIQTSPTFQIRAPENQDTRVIIADQNIATGDPGDPNPGSIAYFEQETGINLPTRDEASLVAVIVDGNKIADFYSNKVILGNLEIGSGDNGTDITVNELATNENIYFRTQGTGLVAFDYGISLDYGPAQPAVSQGSGKSVLWSNTPAAGGSGVWFVNDLGTTDSNYAGELISKSKAFVYSMLF